MADYQNTLRLSADELALCQAAMKVTGDTQLIPFVRRQAKRAAKLILKEEYGQDYREYLGHVSQVTPVADHSQGVGRQILQTAARDLAVLFFMVGPWLIAPLL